MQLKDLGLQRINLDLSNNITENFFAKEGDVGTRGLFIKVLNNSVEIDTTGVSIAMYARVGQEVYSVDATVKDALKGEYELIYPTSILKSGIVYAELQLKKLNDIISTKKFKILVESGIVTDSVIEGHDSYPIFEQLLEAGANEVTRIANEEIRKLNEIARDDAESLRGVRLDELEVDFTTHKDDYATQRQQDQLKVATVEKGLNDYKSTVANVNVNQEAKQKVSEYGIVSLPKNTANGRVSVSVKGRTLKNELNYNPLTMENWVGINNAIIGNGKIELRRTIEQLPMAEIPTNLKPNTKYGVLVTINEGNGLIVTASDFFSFAAFADSSIVLSGVGNAKATATTLPTISTNALRLKMSSNNTYAIFSSIRMFELPVGSEIETDFTNLTADQLAIKYAYIKGDSTKSTVSASGLKSVGKNLWNLDSEWKIKETVDGIVSNKINGYVDAITLIPFNASKIPTKRNGYKQNTRYTVQAKVKGNVLHLRIYYTDGTDEVISWSSTSFGNKIGITALGKTVRAIGFSTGNIIDFAYIAEDTFQLEEGALATPYEPYIESTSYLPNVGELRSLPNGVRDEVRVSGGKSEWIKRVSDKITVQASDFIHMATFINVDVANTKALPNANWTVDTPGVIGVEGKNEYIGSGNLATINDIGKFRPTTASLAFIVAKGTTLEQAKAQLVGLELTYQLANEIVTPIQTSGNLISYPSGTVYVENVVADAGNYTTKFDIKELQLPIKNIDKLIKYNFTTGVQTALDASLSVINEDKKSFTHPNLAKDDMVFVDYFYDVEGTLGETTIEYLDSRHTIKDSVNNKFYGWNIKSTNGVPTVELTEVL